MGIAEYWIVDYLGIGGKYHIGLPKRPTVTVCYLENGEYQKVLLRQGDITESRVFPELALPVDKLLTYLQAPRAAGCQAVGVKETIDFLFSKSAPTRSSKSIRFHLDCW